MRYELAPVFADSCQSWRRNRCGNRDGPRTYVLGFYRQRQKL